VTALAALVLVGVVVVVVLYPLTRPPLRGAGRERHPLEEEREALYRALREIDADLARGELTAEHHAELRARYEARAAAVLARLDREAGRADRGPSPTGPAPETPPASRMPAWLPWAAGSAVVLAGILLSLTGNLLLRLPGETITTAGSPDDPERVARARLAELRAAAAARPADAALQIELGRLAFALDDLDTAAGAFFAALLAEPGNAEAHARLGAVLYVGGLPGEAVRLLDRALELAPDFPTALNFRAIVALEWEGAPARAIALWERYAEVAATPEARAGARALIERARAALAAQDEAAGAP
jgi:cytochrome c-type biogenesis protein CcmH/NrfG